MAQKENLSLSFCPEKDFQGIGEKEFSALVQAEKAVTSALEAVVTSREKRENATTSFLKAIGAYTKAGKPTKAAMESGPAFVTSWAMQFFNAWPEVKRPGRDPEPAAIGNENVKALFTPEEHKALTRAYSALATAISTVKKPAKPAAQDQDKPAAQDQDKPAAQDQDKPAALTATKKAILLQEKTTLQWVLEQIAESDDLDDLKKTVEFALSRAEKRIKKAA